MKPWPMYMEQTPFFTDDEQAPKQMKQSGDDELTSGTVKTEPIRSCLADGFCMITGQLP